MASPAVHSIAHLGPILSPTNTHWRNVLLDSLALIEDEIWDEQHSEHPGARHRLAELYQQQGDRRLQLALLEVS